MFLEAHQDNKNFIAMKINQMMIFLTVRLDVYGQVWDKIDVAHVSS